MTSKTNKKTDKNKYTKLQRNTLIVSAVIMIAYVVLAYFVTSGSFWEFATAHMVLAAVAILFIWMGGAPKPVTYIAIALSVIGAGTALLVISYYLLILGALANG